MTWSDLIALAANHAPQADVWLSVQTSAHVVKQHYRLVSVRGDGECVMLDGGAETVEGGGVQ